MSRWPVVFALLVLLTAGLAASVGCGGGDKGGAATGTPSSAAAAIEAAVRAQAEANNNKDVDSFVALLSDSFINDQLHVSRQEARDLVAQFIGEPLVEITRVSTPDVSGDSATADVDSNEGVIVSRERYSFARENGQWLIAGVEDLPVDVPDSARAVDLRLVDNAYQFDDQAVKDGSFVFNVTNAGTQQHEVELMRLPAGVNAQQLIDPENNPAGVETIGLFGPLEARELRPIVFSGPLEPGNYALVCYLTDVNSVPFSQLGMLRGFTVS